MPSALLYIRVSTEDQADGASLEVQERACRSAAARDGLDVADAIEDAGLSAKTTNREGLLRLLERCRKERPAAIIVHKLDRLARNSADHHAIRATLAHLGVRLISATENLTDDPAGRLMESLLAGVAQFDNEVRGERTKLSMRAIAASGGWCYRPPIGYLTARDAVGRPTLKPDPERAPAVKEALEDVASGQMIPAEAARRLGIRLQRCLDLLVHPVYAGFHEQLGVPIKGTWPSLISRETHDRLIARMRGDPDRTPERIQDRLEFPLRGFLRCECGRPLTGSFSKGKLGKKYAYYHCNECGSRLRADQAESEFMELLQDRSISETDWIGVDAHVREAISMDQAAAETRMAAAKRKVEKLERERKRLLSLVTSGTVDQALYRDRDEEIRVQISVARVEATDADIRFQDLDATLAFALTLCRTPAKFWQDAGLAIKRAVSALFFPGGLILPCRTPANNRAGKHLQVPAGPDSVLASLTDQTSNPVPAIDHIERIRLSPAA